LDTYILYEIVMVMIIAISHATQQAHSLIYIYATQLINESQWRHFVFFYQG